MFYHPIISQEMRSLMRYWRPWRQLIANHDVESSMRFGKEKFQASMDLQHFKPEDITVQVSDNVVTVEGKHEEQQDRYGCVSRHFVRKFVLPEGHDLNKLESTLSPDGVLSITAPRIVQEEQGRTIPITRTDKPHAEDEASKK
ncbi:hypothetical protein MTP99_018133 [Tenebrio molitor]|nr:hypothetical protein MTP99_018133 [Tenebrio molitor]